MKKYLDMKKIYLYLAEMVKVCYLEFVTWWVLSHPVQQGCQMQNQPNTITQNIL